MRRLKGPMNWLAILILLFAPPAFAEDDEEETDPPSIDPITGRVLGEFEVKEEEPAPPPPQAQPPQAPPSETIQTNADGEPVPPPIDPTAALQLQPLEKRLYRWLRPDRGKLEQVPRAQTDFTAYTLEFGEVKMGLANITAGVAPRVQLGTTPILHALDLPNVNLKVNPMRVGGFDMSVVVSHYALGLEEFQATYTSFGGLASIRLMKPWSIHLGASNVWLTADGMPDVSAMAPILSTLTGQELSEYAIEQAQDTDLNIDAQVRTFRFATDVRFNRRDSLVLQASTTLGGDFDSAEPLPPDFELPPILGIDAALEDPQRIDDTMTASVSWQLAWKHTELRLGFGYSTSPGAWLLQSTEFSYRFGGPTRRSERRMRQTWRQNREEIGVPQNLAPSQSEIEAARSQLASEGVEPVGVLPPVPVAPTDVSEAEAEGVKASVERTDDERAAEAEEDALLEEEESLMDDE